MNQTCIVCLLVVIVFIIIFIAMENFYKNEGFSNYDLEYENLDKEMNETEKTEYLETEIENIDIPIQEKLDVNRCPKCRWVCPPGECSKKCIPLCKKPSCVTRCKPLQPAKCEIKCEKPKCKNICPKNTDCVGGNCPQCYVKCTPPRCEVKCCKPKPECIQQCDPPDCSWDCSRPNDCPPPKCKMVCDGDEQIDNLNDNIIGFNENLI